ITRPWGARLAENLVQKPPWARSVHNLGRAKANAVHNPRSLGGKKDRTVGSPRVGNTRRGDNTRGYSHSNSQTRHDPHDTPKCPRPLINSIRQFTIRAIRFAWRNLNNGKLCMREIVQREMCLLSPMARRQSKESWAAFYLRCSFQPGPG